MQNRTILYLEQGSIMKIIKYPSLHYFSEQRQEAERMKSKLIS